MTAPFVLPARGPQIGAPASLENVPVERLTVDPTYQRTTDGPASRRLIASMVAQWEWRLCQPLVVARRADGALLIIDGQHRHTAAVLRGDIPFLPCTLQSSLDLASEASTFIALNTARQKLSQANIFHAQLAAGNPHAVLVQQLLEETGWRQRASSNSQGWNAGDMNCAPMLVKQVANDQEDAVRFALATMRQAWPERVISAVATFLKALIELHGHTNKTPEDVAAMLASRSTDRWMLAAGEIRSDKPKIAIATALAMAIQRGLVPAIAVPKPPPAPAPAPQPTPAAPPPKRINPADVRAVMQASTRTVFTNEGRAWCGQCEQLRTRAAVDACTSNFCKLKGAV